MMHLSGPQLTLLAWVRESCFYREDPHLFKVHSSPLSSPFGLFFLFYLTEENLVARFETFYHHFEQVKEVCHIMALTGNSDFFPPKEKKNKNK